MTAFVSDARRIRAENVQERESAVWKEGAGRRDEEDDAFIRLWVTTQQRLGVILASGLWGWGWSCCCCCCIDCTREKRINKPNLVVRRRRCVGARLGGGCCAVHLRWLERRRENAALNNKMLTAGANWSNYTYRGNFQYFTPTIGSVFSWIL